MREADKAKARKVFAREQCPKCDHIRLYKQLNPDVADKELNILDGCPFDCKAIDFYYTFIENQRLSARAHRNVINFGPIVPECFQDNMVAIIKARKLSYVKVCEMVDADGDHFRRQMRKDCRVRETVAMRYCKGLMLPYEFMMQPHDPNTIMEELKEYELRK